MNSIDEIWNDKMNTGIDYIDSHHKILLSIIIEIKTMIDTKTEDRLISKILSELVSYTKYHFSAEERLMIANKYDDYGDHKKEHEFFTQKIEENYSKFASQKIFAGNEMLNFLKDWLINHILNSDIKLGNFIKNR